jgi:hypothetical protein
MREQKGQPAKARAVMQGDLPVPCLLRRLLLAFGLATQAQWQRRASGRVGPVVPGDEFWRIKETGPPAVGQVPEGRGPDRSSRRRDLRAVAACMQLIRRVGQTIR